jgi:hypothetical protein
LRKAAYILLILSPNYNRENLIRVGRIQIDESWLAAASGRCMLTRDLAATVSCSPMWFLASAAEIVWPIADERAVASINVTIVIVRKAFMLFLQNA